MARAWRAAASAPAARAGAAAAAILLAVYAATLAVDITFWDAGEFVAAAASFGVPHPPGTPLYLLLARGAAILAGAPHAALALSILSAVSTAAACGVAAALVARWTRDAWAGLAAGVAAGTASSVWLSATEPEVYSVALLLVALALWCADAVRRAGGAGPTVALTAYAIALAVPLHLSALVAAPAVVLLAAGAAAPLAGAAPLLAAAALTSIGAATTSAPLTLAGVGALALAAALRRESRRPAAQVAVAVAVACSAVLVLLVRARHDPAVNQGNPATRDALLAVIGRAQYADAGLWPRQAPAWLQLANLAQYADWQFGLGLAPGPPPSAARVAVTLLFAALAWAGARAHRRADPGSWRAALLLFVTAGVGVTAYLNLKAGPSIGWGILADDAPHEARERDYFFAVAFWAWGLWAGAGAVVLARWRRLHPAAGVALAALPIAANWAAVDRRREPAASLPRAWAATLLGAAPARAVLVAAGDNDSYPLWHAQQAVGLRRDVTVVTVPLLPAAWYRAELARRDGLVAPGDTGAAWRGSRAVLAELAARARRAGRPVVATAMLDPAERAPLAAGWTFDGVLYRARGAAGVGLDTAAASRHARRLGGVRARPPHEHAGGAARYVHRLLGCPAAVAAAGRDAAADSLLATLCGRR